MKLGRIASEVDCTVIDRAMQAKTSVTRHRVALLVPLWRRMVRNVSPLRHLGVCTHSRKMMSAAPSSKCPFSREDHFFVR